MAEIETGNGPGEIVELRLSLNTTDAFIQRVKQELIRTSAEQQTSIGSISTALPETVGAIAGGIVGGGSNIASIQAELEKAKQIATQAQEVEVLAMRVGAQSRTIASNIQGLFANLNKSRDVTKSDIGSSFSFGGIVNPGATGFTVNEGGSAATNMGIRNTGERNFRRGANLSREDLQSLASSGGQIELGKSNRLDISAGSSIEEIISRIQQKQGFSVRPSGEDIGQRLEKFIGILAQYNAASLTNQKTQLTELRLLNQSLKQAGLPTFEESPRGARLALGTIRDTKAGTANLLDQFENKRSSFIDPATVSQQRFVTGAGSVNISDFKQYVDLQKELATAVQIIKSATKGILDPGTVQRLGAAYNTVKRNLEGTTGVVHLLERLATSVDHLSNAGNRTLPIVGQFNVLTQSAAKLHENLRGIIRSLSQLNSTNVNIRLQGGGNVVPESRQMANLPTTLFSNIQTIARETTALRNEVHLLRGTITAFGKGGDRRSTVMYSRNAADPSAPFGMSGNFQNQTYKNISGTLLNPANVFNVQKESLKGINAQLDIAYKRVTLYAAAASSVYGVVRAFQAAGKAIADVDSRMAQLRFLMNDVRTNFSNLQKDAFAVAQTFGFSINDTLDAMVVFAQQGRNMADTIKLTQASLAAANQTTMSTVKATEALTSAMALFNVKAEDSMGIIDSWANVANKNAVSAEVLADALKKVGGAAIAAGVDFNQFNALVTTVNEATRKSGQEIGTSLKFIFQRIASPETTATLEKMGIAVLTASGKIRPIIDIFQEVSDKLSTFSDAQRRSLLTTIAGIRHYSDLNLVLNNLDKVYKVIGESQNAFGTSARNNEIVIRTLVKEFQNLRTSFAEVATEIGSGGVVDFVRLLTGAGKAAATALKLVPDSLKGFITTGALFVAGVSAISTALNGLFGTAIPSLIVKLSESVAAQRRSTLESVKHSTVLAEETAVVTNLARAYGGLAATATGANARFAGSTSPLRSTFIPSSYPPNSPRLSPQAWAIQRQRQNESIASKMPGAFERYDLNQRVASATRLNMPIPVAQSLVPTGNIPLSRSLVPYTGGMPVLTSAGTPSSVAAASSRSLVPYTGERFTHYTPQYPVPYVPPAAMPPMPPGPSWRDRLGGFASGARNFAASGTGQVLGLAAGIYGSGALNSYARSEREQFGGRLGPAGVAAQTGAGALFGGSIGMAIGGAGGAAVGGALGGSIGFIGAIKDYSSALERAVESNKRNLQLFNSQIEAVKELQVELKRIENIQKDRTSGTDKFASSVTVSPLKIRQAILETIGQIGNVELDKNSEVLDKVFTGGTDSSGMIATRFSESVDKVTSANKSLSGFIEDLGVSMDELKNEMAKNSLALTRKRVDDLYAEAAALRNAPEILSGGSLAGKFNQFTGGSVQRLVGKTTGISGDILSGLGLESAGGFLRNTGNVAVKQADLVKEFGKVDDPRIAQAISELGVIRPANKEIEKIFSDFRTFATQTESPTANLNILEGLQAQSVRTAGSIYENVSGKEIAEAINTGNANLLKSLSRTNPGAVKEMVTASRDINAQFFNEFYKRQGVGGLAGNLDFQRDIIKQTDYDAAFKNAFTSQGIASDFVAQNLRKNDVLISGNRQEIVTAADANKIRSIGLTQTREGLLRVDRDEQGAVKVIERTRDQWSDFISTLDASNTVFARLSDTGRSFSDWVGDIEKDLGNLDKTMGRARQVLERELSLIRRDMNIASIGGDSGANLRQKALGTEGFINRLDSLLNRRGLTINSADLRDVPENLKSRVPELSRFVEAQQKSSESLGKIIEQSRSAEDKLRESIEKLNTTFSEGLFQEIKKSKYLTSAEEQRQADVLKNRRASGELSSEDIKKFLTTTRLDFTPKEQTDLIKNPSLAPEAIQKRLQTYSLSSLPANKLPGGLSAIDISVSEAINNKNLGIKELRNVVDQALMVMNIAAQVTREQSISRQVQFEKNVKQRTEGGTFVESAFGDIGLDDVAMSGIDPSNVQKVQEYVDKLQQMRASLDDFAAQQQQQELTALFSQISDSVKALGTMLNRYEIDDQMSAIANAFDKFAERGDKAAQAMMQIGSSFNTLRDELGRPIPTSAIEKSLAAQLGNGPLQKESQSNILGLIRQARGAESLRKTGTSVGGLQEDLDLTLERQKVFGLDSNQDITGQVVQAYKSTVDSLLLERQRLIRDGYDAEASAIDRLIEKYKDLQSKMQAQQDALKPFAKQLDEAIATTLIGSSASPLMAFDDSIKQTIGENPRLKQLAVEKGVLPGVSTKDAEEARSALAKQGDDILEQLRKIQDNISVAFSDAVELNIRFNGLDDLEKRLRKMEESGIDIPVRFRLPGQGADTFKFEGGQVLRESGSRPSGVDSSTFYSNLDEQIKKLLPAPALSGGKVPRDGMVAQLHHGEVVVPSSMAHLLPKEITNQLSVISGNSMPKLQSGGIIGSSSLDWWHGSHALFSQFDIDKLKSGEGNNLYGRGLYFTEDEAIGRFYAESIGRSKAKPYSNYNGYLYNVGFNSDPNKHGFYNVTNRSDAYQETLLALLEKEGLAREYHGKWKESVLKFDDSSSLLLRDRGFEGISYDASSKTMPEAKNFVVTTPESTKRLFIKSVKEILFDPTGRLLEETPVNLNALRSTILPNIPTGDIDKLKQILELRKKYYAGNIRPKDIDSLVGGVNFDILGEIDSQGGSAYRPSKPMGQRVLLGAAQIDPSTGTAPTERMLGRSNDYVEAMKTIKEHLADRSPIGPERAREVASALRLYGEFTSNAENFDLNAITHEKLHGAFEEVRTNPATAQLFKSVEDSLKNSTLVDRFRDSFPDMPTSVVAEEALVELLTGDFNADGTFGKYNIDPGVLSDDAFNNLARILKQNPQIAELMIQSKAFMTPEAMQREFGEISPEVVQARAKALELLQSKLKRTKGIISNPSKLADEIEKAHPPVKPWKISSFKGLARFGGRTALGGATGIAASIGLEMLAPGFGAAYGGLMATTGAAIGAGYPFLKKSVGAIYRGGKSAYQNEGLRSFLSQGRETIASKIGQTWAGRNAIYNKTKGVLGRNLENTAPYNWATGIPGVGLYTGLSLYGQDSEFSGQDLAVTGASMGIATGINAGISYGAKRGGQALATRFGGTAAQRSAGILGGFSAALLPVAVAGQASADLSAYNDVYGMADRNVVGTVGASAVGALGIGIFAQGAAGVGAGAATPALAAAAVGAVPTIAAIQMNQAAGNEALLQNAIDKYGYSRVTKLLADREASRLLFNNYTLSQQARLSRRSRGQQDPTSRYNALNATIAERIEEVLNTRKGISIEDLDTHKQVIFNEPEYKSVILKRLGLEDNTGPTLYDDIFNGLPQGLSINRGRSSVRKSVGELLDESGKNVSQQDLNKIVASVIANDPGRRRSFLESMNRHAENNPQLQHQLVEERKVSAESTESEWLSKGIREWSGLDGGNGRKFHGQTLSEEDALRYLKILNQGGPLGSIRNVELEFYDLLSKFPVVPEGAGDRLKALQSRLLMTTLETNGGVPTKILSSAQLSGAEPIRDIRQQFNNAIINDAIIERARRGESTPSDLKYFQGFRGSKPAEFEKLVPINEIKNLSSNPSNYLYGIKQVAFRNATREGYTGYAGDRQVSITALTTESEQRIGDLPAFVSQSDAKEFMRQRIVNAGRTFNMFGNRWSGLSEEALKAIAEESEDKKLAELAGYVLLHQQAGLRSSYHRGGFSGSMGMATFGSGDMDQEVVDSMGRRRMIRSDEVVVPQSILAQGINDDIVRRIPGSEKFAGNQTSSQVVEQNQSLSVRLGGGFQFINQGGGNMTTNEIRKTIQDNSTEIGEEIVKQLLDKPLAIF